MTDLYAERRGLISKKLLGRPYDEARLAELERRIDEQGMAELLASDGYRRMVELGERLDQLHDDTTRIVRKCLLRTLARRASI